MASLKLISDTPITETLDYILEEKNKDAPSNLYVKGPYIMEGVFNKNHRRYSAEECAKEVERFNKEMIQEKRSLGELEHPSSAQISSERACHLITELVKDGNIYVGKSKVLSTPMGLLMKSLIMDGVKMGMSTRSLGQLVPVYESGVEGNDVKNMRLITVDCVADPSCPKAFVNGILESKQYVLKQDGSFEEKYDAFGEVISTLPRKDIDNYLREHVINFIKNFNK
jgi:hypothetical protein